MTLGERIRYYRKAYNWTQADLADSIGMTVSYMSDIERGRTDPSLQTLQKIAAAFQVSVVEILSGVDGFSKDHKYVSRLETTVAYAKAIVDIKHALERLEAELVVIYEKADIELGGPK